MTTDKVLSKIVVLCLVLVCYAPPMRSQIILTHTQSEGPARIAIDAALRTMFQGAYRVQQVLDIDSLLGDMRKWIQDTQFRSSLYRQVCGSG